jgi:outer membrane protein assembly factor BamB
MFFLMTLPLFGEEKEGWYIFHGNAQLTGFSVTGVPDKPVVLTRIVVGARVENTPLIIGKNLFFISAPFQVYSADIVSGKVLWKSDINLRTGKTMRCTASPVYIDGKLLVGSLEGLVVAIDVQKSGEVIWSYQIEGGVKSSATLCKTDNQKNLIVMSQPDGIAYCLDVTNGRLVWKSAETGRTDGPVSSDSRYVVFGNCQSAIFVLDATNGSTLMQIPLGDDAQVAGGVALENGIAFLGVRNGTVMSVELHQKRLLWSKQISDESAFATPAIERESVIFGAEDGTVCRLRKKDGSVLWKTSVHEEVNSPVIAGNKVVVTAGGKIFLLLLDTGRVIWSCEVGDNITSPAVSEGMIVAGCDDSVVVFGAGKR